jgi:peptidoglycan hydrolase CwlO-like protein
MGFSDMMSSGRGPGVIGTLMALLVLVGFGLLYLFVFDSEMQGGGQTIESVIRDQTKELNALGLRNEAAQKELAAVPERRKAAEALSGLNRQIQSGRAKLDGLNTYANDFRKQVDGVVASFEEYKDRYRAQVRGAAAGLKYDELKTASGKTYRQVVVKKVDAVGMSFQHESGTGRADFEDLSDEVRDYFQYDAKQKELAQQQENLARTQHVQEVNVAQTQAAKQQQEQAAREKEALRQKNRAELASLKNALTQLDSQIKSEQDAWDHEREQVRRNGGIVNSARYQSRLGDLRGRRAHTADRIVELQRALGS